MDAQLRKLVSLVDRKEVFLIEDEVLAQLAEDIPDMKSRLGIQDGVIAGALVGNPNRTVQSFRQRRRVEIERRRGVPLPRVQAPLLRFRRHRPFRRRLVRHLLETSRSPNRSPNVFGSVHLHSFHHHPHHAHHAVRPRVGVLLHSKILPNALPLAVHRAKTSFDAEIRRIKSRVERSSAHRRTTPRGRHGEKPPWPRSPP